jgi:hypothetical protein
VTAALVVLALSLVGAAVTGLLAVRWGMKAKDEAGMAADMMRASSRADEERIAQLVTERDEWKRKADVAIQTAAALKTRLAIAEDQRNRAQAEERHRVVESIKAAGAVGTAEFVHGLLSRGPKLP